MTDAQTSLELLGAAHRLLGDVAAAGTPDEAAAAVLRELGPATAAGAGAIWVADRRGVLRCAGTWRADERGVAFERWCRTVRRRLGEGPVGSAMVADADRWTIVPDAGDLERAHALAACGWQGSVVVPLVSSGVVLGGIELVGDGDVITSPPTSDAVAAAATLLAQRLELVAARATLREAENLRQAMFDAALDAFVAIDGDGTVTVFSPSAEHMFGYSSAEAIGRRVGDLVIPPAFRPFHEEGLARYRETGVSRMIGRRTRLSALRADGTQFPVELVVVPVDLPGDTEFAAFVRDVSLDTGIEEILVESGQRFAEQARSLQRSFLPATVPEVDGLDIAVRYRSGGEDTDVGGDFYDVFQTTSGAFAVVIGDVQGKGIEAAAVMALARFSIRGIATRRSRVGAVLPALNEVLLAQRPNRPCTLVYARITPGADGFDMRFGLAGHPPPMLVRNGRVTPLGRPGLLLGVTPAAQFAEQRRRLVPGDVLVLYTDGLTEARRDDGEFLGEERLAEHVRRCHHLDAAAIADELEHMALTFQHGVARDDIALVVLKVQHG